MYVPDEAKVVFVLGSVRSGTSVVGQGLDNAIGTGGGYYEGNLVGLLACLDDAIDGYFRHFTQEYLDQREFHQVSDVGKDRIRERVFELLLSEIAKPINTGGARPGTAGARGDGRVVWIDKSPDGHYLAENVRSATLLARAMPKARFIFCKRHGVANIESRMRRWGRAEFLDHCLGWASVMDAWWHQRDALAGRFLEIDQFLVATRPREAAHALAEFLSASGEQKAALEERFARKDVERTMSQSDALQPLLQDTDWSWAEKCIFGLVCGEQMNRYGYEIGDIPAADGRTAILGRSTPGIVFEAVLGEEERWAFQELPGGFQIHPLPHSRPPATVRLSRVAAPGRARLSAMLAHAHRQGPSTIFTLRVLDPGAGTAVFERDYTVAPGEAVEVSEALQDLPDQVTVEVSTRLTRHQESNAFAKARIGALALLPLG
jgi:hypothetical protein